ncbi:hypothetical protein ACFV3E_11595 [Streptomyces sp. NPDC059718]
MFHRVRRRALLGCVASVLMLSGCTEGSGVPRQQEVTPATASPSAAAYWDDPAEQLADAELWVSTGRHSGGLELALPAKPEGGTVYVATECQGTGTLTVDAGRYGTSTEHCSDRPDGSLNGAAMLSSEAASRLKVTAGPGVTWAVAVGWDERAQGPSE